MPDIKGLGISIDLDENKQHAPTRNYKQYLQSTGKLEKDADFYQFQTDDDLKQSQIRTENDRLDYLKNGDGFLGINTLGRGLSRGVDNLQASAYGLTGLLGDLIDSEDMKDFGLKGSEQNQLEASETYVPIDSFIGTGERGTFGSAGNFLTSIPQAFGEAIPSLLESLVFSAAGAAAGSQVIPGIGADDLVAAPTGAIAGLFARGTIKKYIKDLATKEGISLVAAKQLVTPQVEKQLVKSALVGLSSKVGGGLAVGLTEAGSNFADLSVNNGIDAPVTSLMFGLLSGASESMFGAVPDTMKAFMRSPFADAVKTKAKQSGMKKAASWMFDIMKSSATEGGQEAFQGFLSSLNKEVNDPDFEITSKETFMEWMEQAAAGALVGGPLRIGGRAYETIKGRGQNSEQTPDPSPVKEEIIEGENGLIIPKLDEGVISGQEDGNGRLTAEAQRKIFEDYLASGSGPSQFFGLKQEDLVTREEAQEQGGEVAPLREYAESEFERILSEPTFTEENNITDRASFVDYLFRSGVYDNIESKISEAAEGEISADKIEGIIGKALNRRFPESEAIVESEQAPENIQIDEPIQAPIEPVIEQPVEEIQPVTELTPISSRTAIKKGANIVAKQVEESLKKPKKEDKYVNYIKSLKGDRLQKAYDRNKADLDKAEADLELGTEQDQIKTRKVYDLLKIRVDALSARLAEDSLDSTPVEVEQTAPVEPQPQVTTTEQNSIRNAVAKGFSEELSEAEQEIVNSGGTYSSYSSGKDNSTSEFKPVFINRIKEDNAKRKFIEESIEAEKYYRFFKREGDKDQWYGFFKVHEKRAEQLRDRLIQLGVDPDVVRADYDIDQREFAQQREEDLESLANNIDPDLKAFLEDQNNETDEISNKTEDSSAPEPKKPSLKEVARNNKKGKLAYTIFTDIPYHSSATLDEFLKNVVGARFYGASGSDYGTAHDKVTKKDLELAKEAYQDHLNQGGEPFVNKNKKLANLNAQLPKNEPTVTITNASIIPTRQGVEAVVNNVEATDLDGNPVESLKDLYQKRNDLNEALEDPELGGIMQSINREELEAVEREIKKRRDNDNREDRKERQDELKTEEDKELTRTPDEVFHFMNKQWDVDMAIDLISKKDLKPITVKVADLKPLLGLVQVDKDHAKNSAKTDPMIFVETKDGLLPIDGYHRLRKAVDANQETIEGIPLSESDAKSIEIDDYKGAISDYRKKALKEAKKPEKTKIVASLNKEDDSKDKEQGAEANARTGNGRSGKNDSVAEGGQPTSTESLDSERGSGRGDDGLSNSEAELDDSVEEGKSGDESTRGDRADERSANSSDESRQAGTDKKGAERTGTSVEETRARTLNLNNYHIEDHTKLYPNGEIKRIQSNLKAIEVAKKLDASGKAATDVQKKQLAAYVGWGGLKNMFPASRFGIKPKFKDHIDKLDTLLTKEELETARASIRNAHYTEPAIIEKMWNLAEQLGFKGGNVLEPAAGVGHFYGMMPPHLSKKSNLTAVEMDKISGLITSHLYPDAQTQIRRFENAAIRNNSQDLIITNVPFGGYDHNDQDYKKMRIHDYFFNKGVDLLKPGGVMIAITSKGSLDSSRSTSSRRALALKADLIGSVRLPRDAFKKNAGADVTTDIIVIRKKDGDPIEGQNFLASVDIPMLDTTTEAKQARKKEKVDQKINSYYANNPDMLLGEMVYTDSRYGDSKETHLVSTEGKIEDKIQKAFESLPKDILGKAKAVETVYESYIADAETKPYAMSIGKNGAIVQNIGGIMEPISKLNQKKSNGKLDKAGETARAYIGLRDTVVSAVNAQMNPNMSDAKVDAARKSMIEDFRAFEKKYGSPYSHKSKFRLDPEYPLVLSLQRQNMIKNNGKTPVYEYIDSGLLKGRTSWPTKTDPDKAKDLQDAKVISMAYKGGIDIDYMAKMLDSEPKAIRNELLESGMAFEDPVSGLTVERSEYLSGHVSKKLKEAEKENSDGKYKNNIDSLSEVLPERLKIDSIRFNINSSFIPTKLHTQFMKKEIGGYGIDITYRPTTNTWKVEGSFTEDPRYSTKDVKIKRVIEHAVSGKTILVHDKIENPDGSTSRPVNKEKSMQAAAKVEALKSKFIEVVKANTAARQLVEDSFNDTFNGHAPREYSSEGPDIFPGAATEGMKLRSYQKRAVNRAVHQPALLAHAVGSGKTLEMMTIAMEKRRLGIARKNMIVVQNSTIGQFAASFKGQYPNAALLAPLDSKDFSGDNRKIFLSRIATSEWDAIIIPQSFFNSLADNPDTITAFYDEKIDALQEISDELARSGENQSARTMANKIEKLRDKKESDLNQANKDGVLHFGQLGVDSLIIDEAHEYKKVGLETQLNNIKGLDVTSGAWASSAYMKTRFIHEASGGKNVILATGTPITNTLAEAYTMIRLTNESLLKEYGITNFDQFASAFTDTNTEPELSSQNTIRMVTRMRAFVNQPQLIRMFRQVADVLTGATLSQHGSVNKPNIIGGGPTSIVIPIDPWTQDVMDHIRKVVRNFENMSPKEKRDNSHIPLVMSNLAAKASLDPRSVAGDPSLPSQFDEGPDVEDGKLNRAVKDMLEIYEQSSDDKGTQMMFSDMYYNRHNDFNVFHEVKKKLIEGGVPESEISIVTEVKKAQLESVFTKVNNGSIRFLLGTTRKMGVGVNAQERMKALHHLDAPWMPMELEQRNGRILRDGNIFGLSQGGGVYIRQYGVEKTLDAMRFQRLAMKQRFIDDVLEGKVNDVAVENDDSSSFVLSAEQMAAAFSGNPAVMEVFKLQHDIERIEIERKSYNSQLSETRESNDRVKSDITLMEKKLSKMRDQEAGIDKERLLLEDEKVELSINGNNLNNNNKKVKAATKAIDARLKEIIARTYDNAQYANTSWIKHELPAKGFKLNGMEVLLTGHARLSPDGKPTGETSVNYKIDSDFNISGNVTTGAGFLTSLKSQLEVKQELLKAEGSIARSKKKLSAGEDFLKSEFSKEAELAEKYERLDELSEDLEATAEDQLDESDAVIEEPTTTKKDDVPNLKHSGKRSLKKVFSRVESANDTFNQDQVLFRSEGSYSSLSGRDKAKARQIVQKMTGTANVEFAKKLFNSEGKEVFGKYSNELIQISEGKGDFDNTARHEAMHQVYDKLLTSAEKKVFDEATKRLELTHEEAIEKVNEFANTQKGITGMLRAMAKRMIRRLKKIFGADNLIDKMNDIYDRTLSGELASRGETGASNYGWDSNRSSLYRDKVLGDTTNRQGISGKTRSKRKFSDFMENLYKYVPLDKLQNWDSSNKDISWFKSHFMTPFWQAKKGGKIKQAVDVATQKDEARMHMMIELMEGTSSYSSLNDIERDRVGKLILEGGAQEKEFSAGDPEYDALSASERSGYLAIREVYNKVRDKKVAEMEADLDIMKGALKVAQDNQKAKTEREGELTEDFLDDSLIPDSAIDGPSDIEAKFEIIKQDIKDLEGAIKGLKEEKGYFSRIRDNGRHLLYHKGVNAKTGDPQLYRVAFEDSARGRKEMEAHWQRELADGAVSYFSTPQGQFKKAMVSTQGMSEVIGAQIREKFDKNWRGADISGLYGVDAELATRWQETTSNMTPDPSNISSIEVTRELVEDFYADGLNEAKTVGLMQEYFGVNSASELGLDKEVLQKIFFTRGHRKHEIARVKNQEGERIYVSGYSEDIGEVTAQYAQSFVNSSVKAEAAQRYYKVVSTLDPQNKPNEYSTVLDFVREELRQKGKADEVSGRVANAIFGFYMAGRVSSAAVNLTQNYMIGIPTLMEYLTKAGKKVNPGTYLKMLASTAKAQKDSALFRVGKRATLSNDEFVFLRPILNEAMEAAKVKEAADELKTSARTKNRAEKGWDKIKEYAIKPFEESELNNRIAAALLFYRETKKAGVDEKSILADYKDFVKSAHFEYKGWNRMRIMKDKPIAKAVLAPMFHLATYGTEYTQAIATRMWPAIVAAARGDVRLAAGMIPFLAPVFASALLLRGMAGEDELEEVYLRVMGRSMKKDIEGTFGKFASDTFQRGVVGAMGLDLSGSLAAQMPPQIAAPLMLVGLKDFSDTPLSGLSKNLLNIGFGDKEGVFNRVVDAMPLAIKSAVQGSKEFTEGYTTYSGKPIHVGGVQQKLSGIGLAMKFLGFNPSERASFKNDRWTGRKFKEKWTSKKQDVVDRLIVAFKEGDASTVKNLSSTIENMNDEIINLNELYQDENYKISPIKNSYIKGRSKPEGGESAVTTDLIVDPPTDKKKSKSRRSRRSRRERSR